PAAHELAMQATDAHPVVVLLVDEGAAVAGKGNSVCAARGPPDLSHELAGGQVPERNGLRHAAGDQRLAVGGIAELVCIPSPVQRLADPAAGRVQDDDTRLKGAHLPLWLWFVVLVRVGLAAAHCQKTAVRRKGNGNGIGRNLLTGKGLPAG